MAVESDLQDGTEIRQTARGYEATRMFLVTELTGDRNQRIYRALLHSGIPQYGAWHPAIQGIFVTERFAESRTPGMAKVRIEYGTTSEGVLVPDDTASPQIEIGTSLVQTTATKDVNGNQIVVSHKPTILIPIPIPGTSRYTYVEGKGAEVIQPVQVSVQQPVTTLRCTRREQQAPFNKSKSCVGRMNSCRFAQEEAKHWLCTLLRGVSYDAGASYFVDYEFQLNDAEDGWDAVVVYIDPTTNRIVTDPVVGEGLRAYTVYRSVDFNELNLG